MCKRSPTFSPICLRPSWFCSTMAASSWAVRINPSPGPRDSRRPAEFQVGTPVLLTFHQGGSFLLFSTFKKCKTQKCKAGSLGTKNVPVRSVYLSREKSFAVTPKGRITPPWTSRAGTQLAEGLVGEGKQKPQISSTLGIRGNQRD